MPCSTSLQSQSHAITVDLEDWYHVCGVHPRFNDQSAENARVSSATTVILDLLREYQCKATFFVLGDVARLYPELVIALAADGHEIASHGWSHRKVTDLTPETFGEELDRTAELLERLSGSPPKGFRAPQWSLCPKRTPWAFDMLVERGYLYDSSLAPLAFIGDPDGSRIPYRMATGHGALWEIPPLTTPSLVGNLPTGGGWGFRFFPEWAIRQTVLTGQRNGNPAIFFVHPRELDPDGPRLALGVLRSFLAYGPRSSSEPRLRRLLESFSFTTLGRLVETWQSVY